MKAPKDSKKQVSGVWFQTAALYLTALLISVFMYTLLQKEIVRAVETRTATYAEIAVHYMTGSGLSPGSMKQVDVFIKTNFPETNYFIRDSVSGEIIFTNTGTENASDPEESLRPFSGIPGTPEPGKAFSASEKIKGLGRMVVFRAVSPDEKILFEGYIPYESAIYKFKDIIYLFAIAILIVALITIGTIMIIKSLTVRGSKVEEAEKERDTAMRANQAKSGFLANMSHEIRTPINSMLGMNEMIYRETHEDNIREYSRNVESAGSSLLSLINDILDFSKIESGKFEIIEAEYELSSMLNDIYHMIWRKAEEKALYFELKIDETIPDKLYGDKLRVQQAIMNLLTNAVKYTDSGSVTLNLTYKRLEDESIEITINVSDTGKGIKEEDEQQLFDRFTRLDMKNNNTIEGTGLGLSITKTIMDMMGGSVSVSSVYGAGSVFTLIFPQKIIDNEPLGNLEKRIKEILKEKELTKSTFVAPTAKLLAVDDTAMNLEVIKNLLKKTEINVDTCLSGKECLDLLKLNSYDVILMDARMPQMDGVDTLKAIREQELCDPSCSIIVLTANVLAGAKEMYLNYGFDEYLPKPVRSSDLEMMLLRFLPIDKVTLTDEISDNSSNAEIPEWIRKNRELNIDHAIELCSTPELFMDTITRFESYTVENIRKLQDLLKADDIENFTILVHSIKSSSRLIGADRLSSMAEELEMAGDRNDIPFIREHIGGMISSYAELAEYLSPLMREEEKKSGEIDPESVNKLFLHLKSYVDDFNAEAVGSMLRALNHYNFPGREQARFDGVKKAYEAMDWVAMMTYLEDLEDPED